VRLLIGPHVMLVIGPSVKPAIGGTGSCAVIDRIAI
jgi:hypothetical protein